MFGSAVELCFGGWEPGEKLRTSLGEGCIQLNLLSRLARLVELETMSEAAEEDQLKVAELWC